LQTTVDKLVFKHRSTCPFEIAKQRGIKVLYDDLGAQTRGIYYYQFRQRYILISNKLSEDWQRVICAHELGHDVLHRGINRFFVDDHTFYIAGKFERQANIFAIQLLTQLDSINNNESISDYFKRLELPQEMLIYYKGALN